MRYRTKIVLMFSNNCHLTGDQFGRTVMSTGAALVKNNEASTKLTTANG